MFQQHLDVGGYLRHPAHAGTTNATLALLELTPAEGIRERYEGYAYMCVQMLAVCDGLERSPVRPQRHM